MKTKRNPVVNIRSQYSPWHEIEPNHYKTIVMKEFTCPVPKLRIDYYFNFTGICGVSGLQPSPRLHTHHGQPSAWSQGAYSTVTYSKVTYFDENSL